jgi:hypothetical protein
MATLSTYRVADEPDTPCLSQPTSSRLPTLSAYKDALPVPLSAFSPTRTRYQVLSPINRTETACARFPCPVRFSTCQRQARWVQKPSQKAERQLHGQPRAEQGSMLRHECRAQRMQLCISHCVREEYTSNIRLHQPLTGPPKSLWNTCLS